MTDGESGTVIENTYDAVRNKTRKVEKDKNRKKLSETRYEYDMRGKVLFETVGDGRDELMTIGYTYDIYGNVTEANIGTSEENTFEYCVICYADSEVFSLTESNASMVARTT